MLIVVVVYVVFRVGTAYFSVEIMGGNAIHPLPYMVLSAENAVSLAAVSVEVFQRLKKCPGKISGYGQDLDSSVGLNANFGWTVLELLVNGFSCNSSSPSLREEALFQHTRLTFLLNLSIRSMVTCTQLCVLSTGHGSAEASPEKGMKMF